MKNAALTSQVISGEQPHIGAIAEDILADETAGDRRSVGAVAYWIAWVTLGVWGLQFVAYRRNALWMVLAVFLFTQDDILPAYQVRPPMRFAALLLASVACAMLLYGTSDWWFSVLEGWHSSSDDPLVRQALKRLWFPTLYILGTLLTAGMLVFPFKRALGNWTVVALATLGSFITIMAQSDLILTTAAWHHDWLICAMMLFRALIVGLGAAAVAQRVNLRSNPYTWCSFCRRIWRGTISVPWGITIYLMSVLTSLGLIAYFAFSSNALNPNGLVRVTRQLTIVLFGDVLPYLLFLAGSLIAIRVFGETSPHRPWFCRILQTLVVLVLISVTVSAGISYGQLVGERLRSSLAVVLGTAYSYRLTLDGTGLVFDGNVTYGVADHLNQELRRHPTIRRITLNSGGGLTDEATAAASLIEEAQLDTVVDNSCESACVLMFLAGKQRTLSPLGKLGFHRPVALNPRARMGAISSCGEYARYGVSKEFCEKVDTYSPPAIWYPTPEELAAAHIISASTPGKRFQNLPF